MGAQTGVNIAFTPHRDFLSPYVEAAGSLRELSDEFFDHLDGALGEEGYAIARILTTRRASARLDTRRPLVLVADFAEEMEGKEVLVELVVEVEGEESA